MDDEEDEKKSGEEDGEEVDDRTKRKVKTVDSVSVDHEVNLM